MNAIKSLLDAYMKDIVIEERTVEYVFDKKKIKKRRRERYFKKAAAVVVLTILLAGTTATAHYLYESILVNCEKIPDLGALEVIEINEEVHRNENIEREFSSLNELETFLGIRFLHSSEETQQDCHIQYQKIGLGYNVVQASAYITGDAQNIVYDVPNYPLGYSWKEGNLYKKPINMKIWFLSDSSQKDVGNEYLGIYSFVENYNSAQGVSVNILKEDIEEIDTAYVPYIAIFVVDGIRYELNGRIGLEEMKRVIDTFQYCK